MFDHLALVVVLGYLAVALIIGVFAGRRGEATATSFVAGDREFGAIVMYFVMGATIFSALALLGTPSRVVTHGSDAFYILAYGAFGFVPVAFFGPKVRRIGAKLGYVTQAELLGGRFASPMITGVMGTATLVAFLPYILIQFKAAGFVMEAVAGWKPWVGAMVVYGTVTAYVLIGGVRGVGWTNVLQGIVMLAVVWGIGLWIPIELYGSVGSMFDAVIERSPAHLTLPGPHGTTPWAYSSEILVSALGFSMWPQVFMKCFTGKSARTVQLSAVLYPSFLLFLVPLVFIGYTAVLEGVASNDRVLLDVLGLPQLGDTRGLFACMAFALLAASMSTGDALLHAGGSIAIRDVLIGGFGARLDTRAQTFAMRICIVVLAAAALVVFIVGGEDMSVVDLLLLAYSVPIQFLPLTLAGLYWRRANRTAAEWALLTGLGVVVALFACNHALPELYASLNPWNLQIGIIGGLCNTLVLIALSALLSPMDREHLRRFDL